MGIEEKVVAGYLKKVAGNPVSDLPDEIDSLLQDVAQEYGGISYGDIMKFSDIATEEDLKMLGNIAWEAYEEGPDEGESDEEFGKKIYEKALKIVQDRLKEKTSSVVRNVRSADTGKMLPKDVIGLLDEATEYAYKGGSYALTEEDIKEFGLKATESDIDKLSKIAEESGTITEEDFERYTVRKIVTLVKNRLKEKTSSIVKDASAEDTWKKLTKVFDKIEDAEIQITELNSDIDVYMLDMEDLRKKLFDEIDALVDVVIDEYKDKGVELKKGYKGVATYLYLRGENFSIPILVSAHKDDFEQGDRTIGVAITDYVSGNVADSWGWTYNQKHDMLTKSAFLDALRDVVNRAVEYEKKEKK